MKYDIGSLVRVIKSTDDTMDTSYLNKEGIVTEHNDNEMTGNTSIDPLHIVKFEDGTTCSFWYEELVKIS
jgi:hypothetical protein